jgi:hypothetical protein
MTKIDSRAGAERSTGHRSAEAPGRAVVIVGVLMALWCAGFAAISVWFELTNHFDTGKYAEDAEALSVVNWFVAVLKLVGVGVALLAVRRRLVAPRTVGVVLWAAFATVTVYVVGSITQAFVMLTGIAGDADDVDAASVAYVLAFLLSSVGFGVLAISHSHRAALSTRIKMLGAFGAPVLLGSVLVILPAILRAVGLLSAT